VEIFEANPAAMAGFAEVASVDGQLRCRIANRAMTALLGAGCVGRPLGELLPEVEPIVRATYQTRVPFENVEVSCAGRSWSLTAFPVEDGVGLMLVPCVGAAPLGREELFREVFERTPLGMLLLEWHGRALRINPAMIQMLGYSEAEFAALGIEGVTHPDDFAADVELFQRLMRGEIDHYRLEKRYRHKDGHWLWGALAVSLARDASGNPSLVISTIEDITDEKEAAAERERLIDELQAAVRARETFVSIASHELRTPLTSLQLNLQMLQSHCGGEIPIEVTRSLRQTRRLSALVETLLDVTRVHRGRLDCQLRPTDLSALVKENVERWRRDAGCAIEVTSEGPLLALPGIPVVASPVLAMIDPLRIDQILNNLLSNALKFGGGGTIRVAVGPTWFSVSDQGPGIPDGQEQRIFECFERAVSERQYGGLGLGLFIVKQIVDAHGGAIRVSKGAGATFTVELKAAT
jgi:PAS domain S-box-containing protein